METLKSMLHSLKGKLSMRWKQDLFLYRTMLRPIVLLGMPNNSSVSWNFWTRCFLLCSVFCVYAGCSAKPSKT